MQEFSESLIGWYKKNKRDLPWRNTRDPYKIWLSEIIMQQTRVKQGLSYYNSFVKKYPTLIKLANAPIDEVMKMWQGLGYYSRARNLHQTAKDIVVRYKNIFPTKYKDIKALKGVGDYTAAAISSFAFDEPYAVVDGNVYRLLSRVFNIDLAIDSGLGKKYFQELATELLDKKKAAIYNQAIMEFGALQCRPVNPDCDSCCLKLKCKAFELKNFKELPVKTNKTKIKNRYLNYFVFRYKNNLFIKKRTENDIWKGLYDFYLVENNTRKKNETILQNKKFKELIKGKSISIKSISKEYKHILSHRHLFAIFYEIDLKKEIKMQGFKKIPMYKIEKYAFPRLIEKYINDDIIF